MPYYTDNRGYSTFRDKESNAFVRVHQLAALVDNDPHRVFSPDTEVHHSVSLPQEFGIKLDIPANVSVLNRSEHRKLHANEYQLPPIESVLDFPGDCEEETEHLVSTKEGTGTPQGGPNV